MLLLQSPMVARLSMDRLEFDTEFKEREVVGVVLVACWFIW